MEKGIEQTKIRGMMHYLMSNFKLSEDDAFQIILEVGKHFVGRKFDEVRNNNVA
jgi:hypothetical protein